MGLIRNGSQYVGFNAGFEVQKHAIDGAKNGKVNNW
jgi:hypothetical protein